MVKVEGRRIVRAPVQKVFQLISRLDSAPRVTGLWLTADLIERKPTALTVQYRGYFAGLPVESLQRATLHPPHRIDFRQTRGGLKAFRGQYVLKPVEGDTEVSLVLEAEPGIPFISDEAAALVLHAFVERSLEKFKLAAERELPRVVRRGEGARPAPQPAAAGEAASAAAAPEAEPDDGALAAPPAGPAPNGQAPPGAQKKPRRRRRRRRRPGGEPRRGPGGAGGTGSTH